MVPQNNAPLERIDAAGPDPINDTFLNRCWTLFALKFPRKRGRPRGAMPFLPGNICVKRGHEVHLSEAHTLISLAQNTTIPIPKVHCAFWRKEITFIVMSRMRGRGIGYGWKERDEKSKRRILLQLKGYIQQLRNLTPPKEGYVGALDGCYAYDVRIPAIRDGFKSADSIHDFHRLVRENIDQITGANEKRKADFERLVALQNACGNKTHFSYGDLSDHNILVQGDEVTGIIDWDTSG
jgi:hypothetical protein